jgi:hypothetical protein
MIFLYVYIHSLNYPRSRLKLNFFKGKSFFMRKISLLSEKNYHWSRLVYKFENESIMRKNIITWEYLNIIEIINFTENNFLGKIIFSMRIKI